MRWILRLPEKFSQLSKMSIISFKLGAGMMVCFYIVGLISLLSAPYSYNYFHAMALFRGCMEAAPASLAVGVIAGLLGDMILRFGGRER
ncbi:MAG: hypothetical protein FWE19_07435 [Oscillospiraceae bacterium]|nr:hypothetical protein [Oscillospiraceae bacterium]